MMLLLSSLGHLNQTKKVGSLFSVIFIRTMYFVTGGISELFLDDARQVFIHVKLSFETTLVQLNG